MPLIFRMYRGALSFDIWTNLKASASAKNHWNAILAWVTPPSTRFSKKKKILGKCRIIVNWILSDNLETFFPFQVSEWVINFNGLSQIADNEVHVMNISCVMITYTLETLSSLT